MKELNRDELLKVKGGDGDEIGDITVPTDEDAKKIYVGGLNF